MMSFFNGGRSRAAAFTLLAFATWHMTGHPTVAQSQSTPIKVGALEITSAWTRQPPDGARVAGGYMKITNTGTEVDRLTGGAAAIAGRFEVHEMAMADGVMRMRELTEGLTIKPGETVELKPGGLHLMYMQLRERPMVGRTVKTTLTFEKAGKVEIDVPVLATPPGGAKAHHH